MRDSERERGGGRARYRYREIGREGLERVSEIESERERVRVRE